ncbi:3-phosphoshikimate 1-carboxyvinyltransferase [Geodia barretti]|uniref:3-phosphoshikimate 1-carboxyvinyltransferase n=2 Tax=Geodia barretti TaxID=519541 RepID=A0AA35XGV7_GEOBA|nr:3-phosphoshikimate 1-carboxyvinyltransferase [Geodia barretti]
MKRSASPTAKLEGAISPPADKSVSHRAAILNSLASGEAVIDNFSVGRTAAPLASLRNAFLLKTAPTGTLQLRITSPGLEGLTEPGDVLNAENSGTTMRFIMGLLASTPFVSVVNGDRSLRSRPMARIVQPLRQMGAEVMGRGGGSLAPLTIRGGDLRGMEYDMPVASAQVKSSLIIASLFAGSETVLHQPALSRDHTERMLQAMGATIIEDGLTLVVKPGSELKPLDVKVSGDISSAAFWLVAAAAHPNARVRLTNVGVNPSRAEVLEILKAMGANITLENPRIEGGEPVADIYVESSELRGVEIAGDQIPIAQDEIPVLALAACFAQGTTTIRDAQELRVKESDRISATARELNKLGAKITELPDGMIIEGRVL